MSYRADGAIADLFRAGPIEAASRRIVERVGGDLNRRVTLHTPVASPVNPEAAAQWLSMRNFRYPGELKRSWKVGEVVLVNGARRMQIDVWTEDPIAPYVEWDTRPHLIVPRDPTGVLAFFDKIGNLVFARRVNHPGTRGAHMMATALAEVALSWQDIGGEEVQRWSQEAFAA